MTKRSDGIWEFTGRELRSIMLVLPLLTLVFAAGGAWVAATKALEQKVDKTTFVDHAQQVNLTFQALHTADSLNLVMGRELTDRFRELVCNGKRGCR